MISSAESGSNAEVKIDFDNRKIEINPVVKFKSNLHRLWHILIIYWFSIFLLLFLVSYIIYGYGVIKREDYLTSLPERIVFRESLGYTSLYAFSIIGYYLGLSLYSFLCSLLLLLYHIINPVYSDKLFAKLNTIFSRKRRLILTEIINKLQSNNFIFFIPHFKNVYLEYDAVLDYGYYLKEISVLKVNQECTFKKNTDSWGILFKFSEIPKEGYLSIRYI